MIFLADFQRLSVVKINIFSISNPGFTERYFSDSLQSGLIVPSLLCLMSALATISFCPFREDLPTKRK